MNDKPFINENPAGPDRNYSDEERAMYDNQKAQFSHIMDNAKADLTGSLSALRTYLEQEKQGGQWIQDLLQKPPSDTTAKKQLDAVGGAKALKAHGIRYDAIADMIEQLDPGSTPRKAPLPDGQIKV